MNMFALGHEKQTIKVGLCVFLVCCVCLMRVTVAKW